MFNFDKLKQVYNIGAGLKFADIKVLLRSAKTVKFQPSEYLIEEGSNRSDVFYIKKGMIRTFAINDKGDEITTSLIWENQFLSNPDVVLFNRPSRFYFQALEETEVFTMEYNLLQEIVERNPKLERNRKFILQRMLKQSVERIESFTLYSPEERYIRYVEKNPEIVNRVPSKYIATVLGITPVSLSRIRKRIASKKKGAV